MSINTEALRAIDSREKGAVPISIGTALAVEAAFGQYPDRPESPAPINRYSLVLFNVRTLFRNLVGSVAKEDRERIDAGAIASGLLEEFHLISAVISEFTHNRCAVMFYISDYAQLNQTVFKGATFKVANTPKQLAYQALENDTLKQLAKKDLPENVIHFKGDLLSGKFNNTLIVTHRTVDLLAGKAFTKFDLLESHTGRIKPPVLWGTKLNSEVGNLLPLNHFTIEVFGDGVDFLGKRPTLKRAVEDLAKAKNWVYSVSPRYVKECVSQISDKEIREELLELL